MQVKETKSDKLQREYEVTVKAKTIQEKSEEKLQHLGKTAKLPGFRPGKVPFDMIKKKYSGQVMGEVLEQVVDNASKEAITKQKVRPAVQPKIEIKSFDEGKDLTFTMAFEILPDLPKISYEKIAVEQPLVDLADKEVVEAIENFSKDHKHFEPVKTKRAAKKGDAVLIDFKGFLGDEAFEGGEGKGHQLELGGGQFIPGFEDQLIGSKAGDDKEVNVTFPKEYHKEDLAGKEVKFDVKVHEVQESKPVKVDDAFAKQLGLESLDKLKEVTKKQLEEQCGTVTRAYIKKQLFDILDKDYPFDVPESMFDVEFKNIWEQVERSKEANPDAEEFKKSDKELKKEYQEMAERRVRLGILLSELGHQEKIPVSKGELMNGVMQRARQFPGQEQQVMDYYQKHPQALEEFRGPILEEKVVDFILKKVKVKEKKVTLDELNALDI